MNPTQDSMTVAVWVARSCESGLLEDTRSLEIGIIRDAEAINVEVDIHSPSSVALIFSWISVGETSLYA
jgi:hypothetical protein